MINFFKSFYFLLNVEERRFRMLDLQKKIFEKKIYHLPITAVDGIIFDR